jgi:hypothetical protein
MWLKVIKIENMLFVVKIYTKNHKQKLAGIGEPMVSTCGGLENIDPIFINKFPRTVQFLLSSYMEYIESIGFTPKI